MTTPAAKLSRSLFTAAAVSYTANVALGVGVATKTVKTGNAHWVHHALYISTCTLAAAATSSVLWSPQKAGWYLLPAAVPLALIPYFSARSSRHVVTALAAAPFVAAGLIRSSLRPSSRNRSRLRHQVRT